MGSRTYGLVSIDDESFDVMLAQSGVTGGFQDIKSFINYDDQLIVVRERLPTDHKRELCLHELLHACLADTGVAQTQETEDLIALLAPRLIQLVDQDMDTIIREAT